MLHVSLIYFTLQITFEHTLLITECKQDLLILRRCTSFKSEPEDGVK